MPRRLRHAACAGTGEIPSHVPERGVSVRSGDECRWIDWEKAVMRVLLFAALLTFVFAFLTKEGASQGVVVLTIAAGFVGTLIMTLMRDA